MKALALDMTLLLVTASVSWANIVAPPFTPAEFDVDINQFPLLIPIDNAKSEQIETAYDFTNTAREDADVKASE